MTRNLIWIDKENGWIKFEYTANGKHLYYEYVEIGNKKSRKWPSL